MELLPDLERSATESSSRSESGFDAHATAWVSPDKGACGRKVTPSRQG